jgi:hypothetical protein
MAGLFAISLIVVVAYGRYFIVDTGASGLVISGKKVRISCCFLEQYQLF